MTIKEIANLANVSVATVSYVLNNKGRVSAEIRDRIWSIAKEHGFSLNTNAQNLVKKRNLRIGIMISDTAYLKSSSFFNNVAASIIDKISKRNMDLVILLKENSFENWTRNAIGVDGVVVIDPVKDDIFIDWMCMSKLPFVVIGRYGTEDGNVLSVDADNYNIGYEATKHLFEKGHKNILFNLGPSHYTVTEDIVSGINKAADEFGLKNGLHFCYTPFEIDEQSSKLKTALKVYANLTAVVCASDLHFLNASKQLKILGKNIPSDMSLVCLSGTYLTKNSFPRATSYYTESGKIGDIVADKLLNLLDETKTKQENVKVGYTFDEGETVCTL